MASGVKSALKTIRASQPFNSIATTVAKAAWTLLRRKPPKWLAMHLPRTGVVSVRLPNGRRLRFYTRGDDRSPNRLFWYGWLAWEPEVAYPFFWIAQRSRTILDVGAYIGLYTLLAAHANPDAAVFAFEPLEHVFERLTKNVTLSSLKNIRCVNVALDSKDGDAKFYYEGGLPMASSLRLEYAQGWGQPFQSTIVPTVSVDSFVFKQGLQCVDLLKVDTESTEPRVLQGAIETLKRDCPIVFCEVLRGAGTEDALMEILGPLGYRYYLLTPEGPLLRERVVADERYRNYLFTILGPAEVAQMVGSDWPLETVEEW